MEHYLDEVKSYAHKVTEVHKTHWVMLASGAAFLATSLFLTAVDRNGYYWIAIIGYVITLFFALGEHLVIRNLLRCIRALEEIADKKQYTPTLKQRQFPRTFNGPKP